MKTLILTIGLSIFYNCLSIGQSLLTKKTKYIWDEELNEWSLNNEITWEYENRELVKWTESYFGLFDGNQVRWRQNTKDYENGLLIKEAVNYKYPRWDYGGSITNYIYEDTFLVESQYFQLEEKSNYVYRSKSSFEYNEDGNLILEENFFIHSDGTAIRNSYTENEYNQHGCLVEIITSSSSQTIKNEYSTYQDCEVGEKLVFRKYFDHLDYHIVSLDVYENEFENNELIQKTEYFHPRYDMFLSEFLGWEYGGNLTKKFDIDGRLTYEIRQGVSNPLYEEFWEYDENSRLIKNEKWEWVRGEGLVLKVLETNRYEDGIDDEGRLIEQEKWKWEEGEGLILDSWRKNHFEDERDDNGFLIRHTYKKVSFEKNEETTETGTFTFLNFCDGSVAERYEEINYENSTRKSHTIYEYDHIDCPFEKEQQPLEIFPNPSNGIVQIKGELLQGKSAKISVLNFSGQLIYDVNVPEQSYIYDLDLSHLNNGNYVIFVENGDYFSREKVTIFK